MWGSLKASSLDPIHLSCKHLSCGEFLLTSCPHFLILLSSLSFPHLSSYSKHANFGEVLLTNVCLVNVQTYSSTVLYNNFGYVRYTEHPLYIITTACYQGESLFVT
jgi:hypothetical protein